MVLITNRLVWLAVLIAAVSVGCASDKAVVAQAANSHKQLAPAVITDPQLAAYVQAVGDRIVTVARDMAQQGYMKDRVFKEDPSWMFDGVQFHLVGSETLNAFTTGGQHIYLYSKLFETSKSEDEFAAVVAHEFGHVYGRHVHNTMNRQYATIGLAAGAAGLGYAFGGEDRETTAAILGGSAALVGQAIGSGYSRRDEDEADAIGFEFYVRAGYDPDKFADFFKQMIAKGYETNDPMASHPKLSDRVANSQKRADRWKAENPNWRSFLRPPVANASQFASLQQRSAVAAEKIERNPQVAAAELLFDAFPSCVAPVDQQRQKQARAEIIEVTGAKPSN